MLTTLLTIRRYWMVDDFIVYNMIKDEKITDKQCFYSEMGVNHTDFRFSSIEDLPPSCVLGNLNEKTCCSAMVFYQADGFSSCKLIVKPVNEVEPQNVANHKMRPMVAGCGINNTRAENGPGTLGAFLTLKDQGSSVFLISNYRFEWVEESNYDDPMPTARLPRDYSHCGKIHL